MKIQKLAVLGGDERISAVAENLKSAGYSVTVWGQRPDDSLDGVSKLVQEADAVILPLPVTRDGVHLFSQNAEEFLRLDLLFEILSHEKKPVLGGKLPKYCKAVSSEMLFDYFDSESLQQKNAVATAESALFLAMRDLPCTLDGCKAGILGYGRIGYFLAEKLRGLGAEVTVFARRTEVLEIAKLHHNQAVLLNESNLKKELKKQRAVFNTVPKWILTEEILREIPKNAWLLDLASIPGGFDHALAETLGVNALWGTALPGKCVPESAGKYLFEEVERILQKLSREDA